MKRSSRAIGKQSRRSVKADPAQVELPLASLDEHIQQVMKASLDKGAASDVQTPKSGIEESPTSYLTAVTEPVGLLVEQSPNQDVPWGSPQMEPPPVLPVRRLHNYVYCARLFYYQWVENLFEENADTIKGSAQHRQTDKPSQMEEDPADLDLPEGTRLRSLQLESATLGLVGKIDICEGTEDGIEVIDHKKGSARRTDSGGREAKEADAVQVAAYALLLREQGHTVKAASIYYVSDRRRVPVELTDERLASVLRLRDEALAVASSGKCPPPLRDDPRCLHCSAYPLCLPNESHFWKTGTENPPQLKTPPRPDGDEGEVMVVQKAGCMVGQRGGEFVVSEKKVDLQKFPVEQVRSIYLYGAVQMTAQAVQSCLERNIDVGYFSPAGKFLGLLRGLPASGVDARLGQYRLFGEPGIRVQLAREVVRAKIHNQRVMIMRNGDAPEAVLKRLAWLRDSALEQTDLDSLRGIEGTAAATYFEYFATMLRQHGDWSFAFTERNRRPPRDPVNALLSLGYSVLAKEIAGVCHAVGLDPFLGFYHQPRYGRPALALDLMEEFRPLIADSVAISLLNRGELTPSDFVSGASGCFLKESGRRCFWEAWFRRLDTEVKHPQFGYAMSYRRMLEVQARQLWRYVRGESERYFGFTTR